MKPLKHYKEDDEWVRDHFEELMEMFPGRYVAVACGKVTGVAKTPQGAERKSLRKYPKVLPSVIWIPRPKDLTCDL